MNRRTLFLLLQKQAEFRNVIPTPTARFTESHAQQVNSELPFQQEILPNSDSKIGTKHWKMSSQILTITAGGVFLPRPNHGPKNGAGRCCLNPKQ